MGEWISPPTQSTRFALGQSCLRPFAIATLLMLSCGSIVSATSYGDVEVTPEPAPSAEGTHGYAEIWFRVTNRSKQDAHEVRLTLPQHSYSYGEDHLRAVSRTITVGPEKTARVALLYPIRLAISGNGLAVTIDGREQKEYISTDVGRSSSYSSRYRGYGTATTSHSTVLYSRSIDTRFPDWAESARRLILSGWVPPALKKPEVEVMPEPREVGKRPPFRMPPDPKKLEDPDDPDEVFVFPKRGGPGGMSSVVMEAIFVRAELPSANWSPNWLGYSRYDGIVLTDGDLRSMPAEARSAIGQYVECGGSLLVVGRDPPLPGKWKLVKSPDERIAECEVGFGACFAIDPTDLLQDPGSCLSRVIPSWSRGMQPWSNTRTAAQANVEFPIVEDLGVPVTGLLGLMLVFSIVAGPLTLFLLNRRGRKLWLFWIVPLVSAVTCLTVFISIALSEGWSGQSRIVGITILDENTHRASSLGWTAFYAPLSSGGGLHFSSNTEASLQNGDDDDYHGYRSYRSRSSSASALSIDWTNEQHLVSGWLSPRVPVHFVVRKSEIRRERVAFTSGSDGRAEAVNGLGADLTDLWYADETGKLYRTKNVPAGSKASLAPIERPRRGTLRSIGDIYTQDWSKTDKLAEQIPAILKPRTYLAVMDSAPFFDEGLQSAGSRRTQSVVIGIISEGGDEN